MKILSSIKDHILIGGPNAVAGWGLLALLVISGGISAGRLVADPKIFFPVLFAALCTGNGVYALNAVYDRAADKVNKPRRPLPSGRMTPKHAMRYAQGLMVVGLLISMIVSVVRAEYLMVVLWSLFTVLGIAYSVPPIKLKARHIWGNLCFASFAVLAMFIGLLLSFATLEELVLELGIPVSMIPVVLLLGTIGFAGSITMKDFYDYEGDKANGDVTLVVKLGRKKAAAVSIVLFSIPSALFMLLEPPVTIADFIRSNWSFLLNVVSFGMYIVLDYVESSHHLSDAYSRVLYYYVILTAAYGFLSGPLGIAELIPWEWQTAIFLSAYVTVAFVAVYQSWKAGYDVLKTRIG